MFLDLESQKNLFIKNGKLNSSAFCRIYKNELLELKNKNFLISEIVFLLENELNLKINAQTFYSAFRQINPQELRIKKPRKLTVPRIIFDPKNKEDRLLLKRMDWFVQDDARCHFGNLFYNEVMTKEISWRLLKPFVDELNIILKSPQYMRPNQYFLLVEKIKKAEAERSAFSRYIGY